MSARQIAEPQGPDARPHQSLHLVADPIKHAADLAVNALAENHAHPDRRGRKELLDARSLAIEHDSAQEFGCERRVPRTVEGDLVFFFDFVTWMREPLREIAVVGENEQAFGLRIQPSDIEQPREFWRQKIEDGVPRVRVGAGGNETDRFVQNDVKPPLGVDEFIADFDVIAVLRLGAEISAGAAVNGHPARGDELVAMTA